MTILPSCHKTKCAKSCTLARISILLLLYGGEIGSSSLSPAACDQSH